MRKVITSLEGHTIAHWYVVYNRKKYVYNALVYDHDVFGLLQGRADVNLESFDHPY
jgi:hypothetical protein